MNQNGSTETSSFFKDEFTFTDIPCYEMKPLYMEIPTGPLYLSVFLFILTGIFSFLNNVLVILVSINGKRSPKNIRKYLFNLAFADLGIGVFCLPFTFIDLVFSDWIFPHWLCPVVQCTQLLCVGVASFTLMFIAIERYVRWRHENSRRSSNHCHLLLFPCPTSYAAIFYPLSRGYKWLKHKGLILILLSWLFSALFAAILVPHMGVHDAMVGGVPVQDCAYQLEMSKEKRHLLNVLNFVITYFLPGSSIGFMYLRIYFKLRGNQGRELTNSYPVNGISSREAENRDPRVDVEVNLERISSPQPTDRQSFNSEIFSGDRIIGGANNHTLVNKYDHSPSSLQYCQHATNFSYRQIVFSWLFSFISSLGHQLNGFNFSATTTWFPSVPRGKSLLTFTCPLEPSGWPWPVLALIL